jgi:glycerol-3-phosphate dehydrogenase (NAD(P)+)
MQAERANSRYLPGIRFPDALTVVSGDVMAHVADADLIVLGTPMAALRQWLGQLRIAAGPWSGCARASRPWPPHLPAAMG